MNSVIDFNSKVTLKLVVEVIIVVVAIVSMWFNLRNEIRGVESTLEVIKLRLNSMESGDWQASDDFVFMQRFSTLNKLEMPTHRGDN